MFLGILQDLGLTLNEAKIYQALVSAGELNINSLSVQANIHRRNIYDSLDRLIEKGLVLQILNKGDNYYQAVQPDSLLNLVKEKEDKLKQILPELQKIYATQPYKQQVIIYRGLGGLIKYWQNVLESTQQIKIDVLNPTFFCLVNSLRENFINFLKQASKQSINLRYLLNGLNDQYKEWLLFAEQNDLKNYKFLPTQDNKYSALEILNDRVTYFSGLNKQTNSLDDLIVYVIFDRRLADGQRQWFDIMWQYASVVKNN